MGDISGHFFEHSCEPNSPQQTINHRLDSWKEIAAFFGRDERTVRRWEKERGLPIHRVPGGGRGGVFAHADELREWLKGPGDELDPEESVAFVHPQVTGGVPGSEPLKVLDIRPLQRSFRPSFARAVVWLAPLLLVGALIGAVSFSRREISYKNALAAPHPPNPEIGRAHV